MTLEQQYINKFNFESKNFADSIQFSIKKDEFLYYIEITYTSPDSDYDTINLKLFNLDKINIESKISKFNKDYYTIFPVMLNLINTFTSFLEKNPLIFIDYLKEKQIQECKENKIIKFDANKLYNSLIDKDTDYSLFLKNMKYNKSYPIEFIETVQCSDNEFFYLSKRNFKLKYKDNLYYLFFTNKNSISLSFEQIITLLSYFSVDDKIGIFNQLGEQDTSKSSVNLSLTTYDKGSLVSDLAIEKFLLNVELEKF